MGIGWAYLCSIWFITYSQGLYLVDGFQCHGYAYFVRLKIIKLSNGILGNPNQDTMQDIKLFST